ncbi:MAG: hypothetical protein APF76_06985 [Desulfitibacter sp. BRH_c19]|nr:MAG: hypothetical protein APF76_06985 [Desulfitibacter sp. BRH_c19]
MKLYNEYINTRINEEAFAIEQTYFVKTDRRVNPKEIEPYKFFLGSIPILITAPHAVRHIRKKRIKPSDQFTGAISVVLHNKTNAYCLAATKLYGGDPAFDKPCIFKEKIREIVTKHRIKFVIDIHGASGERPFDVDIGSMNGISFGERRNFVEEIKNCFQQNDIKKITLDNFPALKQHTITRFVVEELNCSGIQLEINRKYRAFQNLNSFAQLMASLTCAVNYLSKKSN